MIRRPEHVKHLTTTDRQGCHEAIHVNVASTSESSRNAASQSRANASYADQLLKSTTKAWAVVTGVWIVVLLILTGVKGLSNLQILAGVVLPILPLFLDVLQYIRGIWRASTERADLAKAIEAPAHRRR